MIHADQDVIVIHKLPEAQLEKPTPQPPHPTSPAISWESLSTVTPGGAAGFQRSLRCSYDWPNNTLTGETPTRSFLEHAIEIISLRIPASLHSAIESRKRLQSHSLLSRSHRVCRV